MKKKSIALRLGVFALALTLVTTSLSSGTLAKYQTSITAHAQFMVAKWDPQAAILDSTGSTLNITNTINLRDTVASGTIKNTTALSSGKIAPGTKGNFFVEIDANGAEASLAYSIKMYRTDDGSNSFPENLVFWTGAEADKSAGTVNLGASDKDDDTTWVTVGTAGTIEAGTSGSTAKKQVRVWWEWPYEAGGTDGNEKDTLDGNDSATLTFDVVVSMVQVDPTKTAT